mmetsp:Transcript_13457/g.22127  ORF Transcript_13457/g.22127 Transcript_13457/m.22127 type:complete len:111 (+) Transcript_13457:228-560(+)
MKLSSALLFAISAVTAKGFAPIATVPTARSSSLQGTASPTVEKESFQRSLLAAQLANKSNGKKAVDAPPVNIGWDSHQAVVSTKNYGYMIHHDMQRDIVFVLRCRDVYSE